MTLLKVQCGATYVSWCALPQHTLQSFATPVDTHHHHLFLNSEGVRAPKMTPQPVSSIFPSSPLPSGTSRTPSLSIPWWCLPTSSSVCLVFFPLSLCLAWWFWPDLTHGYYKDVDRALHKAEPSNMSNATTSYPPGFLCYSIVLLVRCPSKCNLGETLI